MNLHFLVAPLAVAAAAAAWLAVQRAWRRSFADTGSDPDALAARRAGDGCHSHCDEPCELPARPACASSREELK